MLDWLASRLDVAGGIKWSVRSVFVGPDANEGFRKNVVDLLIRVQDGGDDRDDLVSYVGTSLGLNKEELITVCWEQPRALLLDVVPTAVRRLVSTWGSYRKGRVVAKSEPWVPDHPLPEFIPRSLFSDLCLPEVAVYPPKDYDRAAETSLAVAMALGELAPGRVTLRWAVRKVRGLWVPPPSEGSTLVLEERLAPGGEVLREVPGPGGPLPLVRPVRVEPLVPEANVLNSSNGRLHWQFLAEPVNAGIDLVRPRRGPFDGIVICVRAYLHAGRGALRTWRYATSGTADVARRSGRSRWTYELTWRGDPAAVGYEAVVDALEVSVRPPADLMAFRLGSDARRLRQLRVDKFSWELRADLRQACDLNPFLSQWVTEVVVAIAARTVVRGPGLTELVALPAGRWSELAQEVVSGVVVALDNPTDDEQKLSTAIVEALAREGVVSVVERALPGLWAEPDESWLPWLQAAIRADDWGRLAGRNPTPMP